MIRCKWFSLQGVKHFNQLFRSIENLKFSVQSDFGFDVRQHDRERLSADCITRFTEVRRIESPFGDTELMQFENYERTNFTIFLGKGEIALIRFEAPPRSLANVIRALESAASQKIYLSQISLSCDLVKRALSGLLFKMLSAELGDVVYGPNMIGRALVTATEGKALDDLGVLTHMPHRLEGFKAVVVSNTESTMLTVSRSNVLTIRGTFSRAVLERVEVLIRKELAD